MNMSMKQSNHWKSPALVAVTLLLLTGLPSWSQAQLRIEVRPFESMTRTGDAFLRGEPGKPVVVAGELRIPKPGTDKLPAVIFAHASGGINAGIDRWAQELNSIGVAVFLVDSFSGRGMSSVPPDPSNDSVMWMIVDAYRALGMLAQHPRIDPQRIAIMGWSTGGPVAIYSSMERLWRSYGPPNIQFAAHIGFYGSCAVVYRDEEKVTGKPIRVFHGTADDLELIEPCRAYVARLKKAGADVAINEYAGVQHAYDWFMFKEPLKLPQARTVRNCSLVEGERGQLVDTNTGKPYDPNVSCNDRGGTLLYNEPAAVATTAAVKEFLTTTFGLKP
jgi:dienelactone hydrolase